MENVKVAAISIMLRAALKGIAFDYDGFSDTVTVWGEAGEAFMESFGELYFGNPYAVYAQRDIYTISEGVRIRMHQCVRDGVWSTRN